MDVSWDVQLLLADSTNAEEKGHSASETTVGRVLYDLFHRSEGRRIITACFASHIHRVQQIADAALAFDRKVAFVGMSMQDLNVRRLLHYSTAELRGSAKPRPTRSGLRHFAILKRPDDTELERLTDISLRRIGARSLWVDDFEEIPARLGHLYGPEWPAAFSLEKPRPQRSQRSAAARRRGCPGR